MLEVHRLPGMWVEDRNAGKGCMARESREPLIGLGQVPRPTKKSQLTPKKAMQHANAWLVSHPLD